MPRKLLQLVESALDRRAFLRKVTTIAGALVAGVVGAPRPAYACYGCCGLCLDPGGGCSFTNCACTWNWKCPDYGTCRFYRCYECFENPVSPCDQPCYNDPHCGITCVGVKCSAYAQLGQIPECYPQ